MHSLILSDILEMYTDRIYNADFPERSTQRFDQTYCIVVSTICGSKTRHCHSYNVFVILSDQIKRFYHNKQGKRRIQSAGNTNHRCGRMGMFQTFFQSHGLDHKNLLAAFFTVCLVSRHERRRIHKTGQFCFFFFQTEFYVNVRLIGSHEGTHPTAFLIQTYHIKFCIYAFVAETSGLCQQRSVLCDQIMTGIYHILGGFPVSGTAIYITTDQTAGLPGHQALAVHIFSGCLITGRKIDQQCRTCQSMLYARWIRSPHILTDFRSDLQFRHLSALE